MTEINIKDFGAKNNGKFDNTKAFKSAFDELAKNGGGKLVVGEGVWLTGPIDLVDNAILELKEGAELSFISDPSVYPPAYTRWEGVECYAMHALLRAADCKNVTITGKGTINGNGNDWWGIVKAKKAVGQSKPMATYELALAKLNPGFENQAGGGGGRETQFLRPCLVEFMNCHHVVFEGIQLKNSPFWTPFTR